VDTDIYREAQVTLKWIKDIIKVNSTLTTATKIQALKNLDEESQKLWRQSGISYSDALEHFEIFANCLSFHTKKPMLGHTKKYFEPEGDSAQISRSKSKSSDNSNSNSNEEPKLVTLKRRLSKPKADYDQLFLHEDPNKHYGDKSKIGKGGFGEVFIAKRKSTGQQVAIKILRKSFDDFFRELAREISLLKSCHHPNIVNFIESYVWQNQIWIVMEYCSGGSLHQLCEHTIMGEDHISYIACNILHGLAYLHSSRHIHRDIKADNILLNMDGSIKLADLGIAAELDDEDSQAIGLCGSKYWMAPEMIKHLPYDYKVDIWGFGCLIIELAEGRHPYYGQHSMGAMFQTATKGALPLESPEKWSRMFKDFMENCFQMDPNVRPSAEILLKHPFIVTMGGNEEKVPKIKEEMMKRIESVFLGDQLAKMGIL